MPVIGAGRSKCESAVTSTLRSIKHDPAVKEVFLVSIWRKALSAGGEPFLGGWAPENEFARVFEVQLPKMVQSLKASGNRVTIFAPFLQPRPVPETLAANIAFDRDWAFDTPLADHNVIFAPIFRAFDALIVFVESRSTLPFSIKQLAGLSQIATPF